MNPHTGSGRPLSALAPGRLAAAVACLASLAMAPGTADDTAPLGGRTRAQPSAAAVIALDGTAALASAAVLPPWPASFDATTAPACAGGDWYWRTGTGAPPPCGDARRIPPAALRCLSASRDLARDGFAILVGVAQLDATWRGAGTRWGAPAAGNTGEWSCAADLATPELPFPVVASTAAAAWSSVGTDRAFALDFTGAPFDTLVTVYHPAFVAAWHGTWTQQSVAEGAARAAAALTPAREDALTWLLQADHPGPDAAHGGWVSLAATPPAALPARWAERWAQLHAAPPDGPSPHGEMLVEALRLLRGEAAVPGPERHAAPGIAAPVVPGSRSPADPSRYRSPLDAPCRHALLATFAAGPASADEDFPADWRTLRAPRPDCTALERCFDLVGDWLADGFDTGSGAHAARAHWLRLTSAPGADEIAEWPLRAGLARAAHLDIPALADLGPRLHLQAVVPWGNAGLAVAVQPSPHWQWAGAVHAASAGNDGTALQWVDLHGSPLTDGAGHLVAGAASGTATPFVRSLPIADGTLPGGPWWFAATSAGTLDAYAGAVPARQWSWTPPAPVAPRQSRWAAHRARGLDGDPLRVDAEGRKLVVTGTGRGNIGYHAVDVTDPASPRTAWAFTAAEWPADGPAAPGESTATPARARLALPGLGPREVLLVPGGEDPTLRGGRPQARADRAGAALHVLDAATGQRLWSWAADPIADRVVPGLQHSIIAAPRVLDDDRDGVADWLLALDAWGTVALVDVRATAVAGWGEWTVVAELADDPAARAAFHHAPTAVRLPGAARDPAAWLVIVGSGHAPDLTVGETGALHAWRLVPKRPTRLAAPDLVQIGTDGRAINGSAATSTAPGWRMVLAGDREQVTAMPRVSGGDLLVATWQPPPEPEDADCRRQPGHSRLRAWKLPAPPRGAERVIYPDDPREHELPGAVPPRQVMPWTPPAAATTACLGEGCGSRRYVIAGGRLVALGALPPARRTVWRALEVVP